MKLQALVGSGDKIGLFTLPFLLLGVILNILMPSFFSVGGPSIVLMAISLLMLIPGVTLALKIAWLANLHSNKLIGRRE